jgi:hypothetical protein
VDAATAREATTVDPATLLVNALTTGAAGGVAHAAPAAVQDAYTKLKDLVAARFSGNPVQEMVLAEHTQHPDTWGTPLLQALQDNGATTDPVLLQAAERLMALVDESGARAGKYAVDLRGAQGVQVGDRNRQSDIFRSPPPT